MLGFGISGLDSELRAWGLGFWTDRIGFSVWVLRFRLRSLEFRVASLRTQFGSPYK